jgi:hypothetical protein
MATDQGSNRNQPVRVRASGLDESRKLLAALADAFPDAKFTIEETVNGDRTVVWGGRGTNTGRVGNTTPTDVPATIVVVSNTERRETSA